MLREAVRSTEFWPAMHAAEALTLAGAQSEVLAALGDRLPVERDDQHRCGLARELVRAGDRGKLAVLFDILGDVNSFGRVHAAESLFKVGETGDSNQLRSALAQTKDPRLQLMAAAALARAEQKDALEFLRKQLRSDDRSSRNLAAFALARVGDASDLEPLSSALEEEADDMARAFLISALASQGCEKAREELARNLDSTDPGVRTLLAECVGTSRCFKHQAKLVRLLDDPVLDVRVRAAGSLIALSLPAAER
jgi:sialidase-1